MFYVIMRDDDGRLYVTNKTFPSKRDAANYCRGLPQSRQPRVVELSLAVCPKYGTVLEAKGKRLMPSEDFHRDKLDGEYTWNEREAARSILPDNLVKHLDDARADGADISQHELEALTAFGDVDPNEGVN